jgi:glyoxylase-like metal-dependent hydrolase (beta-lactamase superfamily II)
MAGGAGAARPREVAHEAWGFAALTPTLPPATHTNSYALGSREVLLVEPATPYEDEQREWLAWARALPSSGRTPVAIVATHHHPDHVGGVEVLVRELGLPLWAHDATATRIDVPVARKLVDGETLVLDGPAPQRWEVLHTPGHAPGHVCLWNPDDRALVVGDMVASVGTILIAPGDGDMQVYLEQLERLAGLGARVALPAHGEPIDDPTVLFRYYVRHRLAREAKVASAVSSFGAEGGSLDEILSRAYDDTPRAAWGAAMLSLQSHLIKLVTDGKVREGGTAQEVRYTLAS